MTSLGLLAKRFCMEKNAKLPEKMLKISDNYQTKGLIFTDTKGIFYLTGALFGGFWLLIVKKQAFAICSKMIANQVREYFRGQNTGVIAESDFCKTVTRILKQNGVNTLLVDPKYATASDFISICKNLGKEKINVAQETGILDGQRLIKNSFEIENIRTSCQTASKVCGIVKSELKPGLSELDIHYRVLELFAKNKVSESFVPIIASGPNSANPHHRSSNRKIKKNDIVLIDIGCIYGGYCSDLTRTYFLGRINDRLKEVLSVVEESQRAVLNGMKSGVPISWADKTARSIIETAGYKDNFIHSAGHGIGVEIHEMPSLASNAEGIFLTNMAVTVEPGIYIDGEFGVRIEDTVLIKDGGCEALTLTAPHQEK